MAQDSKQVSLKSFDEKDYTIDDQTDEEQKSQIAQAIKTYDIPDNKPQSDSDEVEKILSGLPKPKTPESDGKNQFMRPSSHQNTDADSIAPLEDKLLDREKFNEAFKPETPSEKEAKILSRPRSPRLSEGNLEL